MKHSFKIINLNDCAPSISCVNCDDDYLTDGQFVEMAALMEQGIVCCCDCTK